jgi:AGCS family alanine or glycine:cation symporter
VDHSAKAGLFQSFGVFIDSIIICTCTAMIMLLAPQDAIAGLEGMPLLQAAMHHHFGQPGVIFIAITLWLFCFSTFIGVLFYARSVTAYLFGDNWASQTGYKIFSLIMLFIGGIAAYTIVWKISDIGMGIMTIINLAVLLPMGGQALKALEEYMSIRKAEKQAK